MAIKKYLLLLVDREHTKLLLVSDNHLIAEKKVEKDYVPKKVKHGDDAWDSQDKIFRHIEDHLHRHLKHSASEAAQFVKGEGISGVLIGGHKPLFSKINQHLPVTLSKKVVGNFITELKIPNKKIIDLAFGEIEKIENKKEVERLEKALH